MSTISGLKSPSLTDLAEMCDRAEQRRTECEAALGEAAADFCPEPKITLQWTGPKPPFEQKTITVAPDLIGEIDNRFYMTVDFKVADVRAFIAARRGPAGAPGEVGWMGGSGPSAEPWGR